jgi:hypothetical protein
MRFGAPNVLPPQPPIKRDGFGELRDVITRAAGKPSAARDRRGFFHAFNGDEFARKAERSHARIQRWRLKWGKKAIRRPALNAAEN